MNSGANQKRGLGEKKKNSSIFAHFLVAVPLSNHGIERDMIYDIIDALDDTISTPLHSIPSDFIQVRCRRHVQSNVQVFEVPFQVR